MTEVAKKVVKKAVPKVVEKVAPKVEDAKVQKVVEPVVKVVKPVVKVVEPVVEPVVKVVEPVVYNIVVIKDFAGFINNTKYKYKIGDTASFNSTECDIFNKYIEIIK